MGRPSRFTVEDQRAILERVLSTAIREKLPWRYACESEDVRYTTAAQWLKFHPDIAARRNKLPHIRLSHDRRKREFPNFGTRVFSKSNQFLLALSTRQDFLEERIAELEDADARRQSNGDG